MHVFTAQDQFAQALSMANRVVAPQNNMPILAGIQLHASADRLTVTSTDLFTLLTVEVPATVHRPGHVVLPAGLLSDLVHRLPTSTVELDVSGEGKTRVIYGRSHATLNGFGHEQLPEFPPFAGPVHQAVLPSGSLSALARQLLFACAKDDTRPILRGVNAQLGSGRLVMAATDGSRLSQVWVPVPDYREPEINVVIPAKFLVEAARLAGTNEPATMAFGDSLVRVTTTDGTITGRLLEGQFPDYRRVIPEQFSVQGRIRIADLKGALERANLIASKERAGSVRLSHRGVTLDISAASAELGQTYESLEWTAHGPEMEILFNPAYLLEALRSLEGDDVLMDFSGVQSPARIREASAASSYSHILLPLRQLV